LLLLLSGHFMSGFMDCFGSKTDLEEGDKIPVAHVAAIRTVPQQRQRKEMIDEVTLCPFLTFREG